VFTSLEVKFLGEVVNRLFEAHIGRKPGERYKPSAKCENKMLRRWLERQH